MYEALGKVMNSIINSEDEDLDLRDRAIFYCKAFQNISGLKKCLDTKNEVSEGFLEDIQLME